MKSVKLIVAYPQPKDASAFEKIYQEEHVPMAIANLAGKDQNGRHEGLAIAARRTAVLSCRGGSFSIHGGAPAVRRVCRRQGDIGQCGEDIVGWASRHHDRRRGHVHVLSGELFTWQRDLSSKWSIWALPIAALHGQNIKTGPDVGQQVPAFSAPDQEGRNQTLKSDHGPERGHARVLPFRGLVTVLQDPARRAGTASGRDPEAGSRCSGHQL